MTTGYFSINELINLKLFSDKVSFDSKTLADLIQKDSASAFKYEMSVSVDYYNAKHDILNFIRKYWRDGLEQENKTMANNKLPHPFHKVLVDEKTAYIAGNPVTMSVAGEASGEKMAEQYRADLINILTERFDDVLYDWVSGSAKKGVEWVHFYVDVDGKLNYVIVPAEQVLAIYDTQYEDKLIYVIRYYGYDFIQSDGKVIKRLKVEFWDDEKVSYWIQIEDGSFVFDTFYLINPFPHWQIINDTNGVTIPQKWGRVPFVPLWNNSEHRADLIPIKILIDSYDKVKSGWMNDLDDFAELLYVIKGLQNLSQETTAGLTELAALVKNIKEDRAIAVDADGDVKTLNSEIPVEAREKFLDITRREIVYFGEGADVSADILSKSHAPSGVALQFLYTRLDMKANRTIRKLQSALKEFVWFITYFINTTQGKNYDSNKVTFTINKAQIFNEAERIQSLVASADLLSTETKLENHPFIDDVQGELERLKKEGKYPPKQEQPAIV